MTVLGLLVRGLLAGLAIAAPVGPVNVLCVLRTLRKGWRAAVVSGLGAATADAFYGSIAAFSITFIIQFLIREECWIRLIGGILLVVVGVSYCVQATAVVGCGGNRGNKTVGLCVGVSPDSDEPYHRVVLSKAVLAALRVSQPEAWLLTWLLVLGVFSGSLLWCCVLIAIVHRKRPANTIPTDQAAWSLAHSFVAEAVPNRAQGPRVSASRNA